MFTLNPQYVIYIEQVDKYQTNTDYFQQIKAELFDCQQLTPKIKAKRYAFLAKLPLFATIQQKKGSQNFQSIIQHIRITRTDFGQIIFNSQENRSFNYILKGAVMLFSANKQLKTCKLYKKLGANQYFGQKMVYGKECIQNARSVGPCWLLQLDMSIFYKAFAGHFKYDQLREKVNFLKQIWVLSQVKKALLQRILLSSETKKYTRNDFLFKTSDQPVFLWVIMQGQITLISKQEGFSLAFCTLNGGQVIGVDQLISQSNYKYQAVCTSDHACVLKIEKQIGLQIIQRDIKPQNLTKRKQISIQIRQHQISRRKESIGLSLPKKQWNPVDTRQKKYASFKRRYKTDAEVQSPIDKAALLDKFFKRELQLKLSKIRPIKLQLIRQKQKQKARMSQLTNYSNSFNIYEHKIMTRYINRKEKDQKFNIFKHKDPSSLKIQFVSSLRVANSTAVKNQKRKLKNSRRHCLSNLEITTFNI